MCPGVPDFYSLCHCEASAHTGCGNPYSPGKGGTDCHVGLRPPRNDKRDKIRRFLPFRMGRALPVPLCVSHPAVGADDSVRPVCAPPRWHPLRHGLRRASSPRGGAKKSSPERVCYNRTESRQVIPGTSQYSTGSGSGIMYEPHTGLDPIRILFLSEQRIPKPWFWRRFLGTFCRCWQKVPRGRHYKERTDCQLCIKNP